MATGNDKSPVGEVCGHAEIGQARSIDHVVATEASQLRDGDFKRSWDVIDNQDAGAGRTRVVDETKE